MRAIFNFIKDALRWVDGQWIESAGHPIMVKGVFKPVAGEDSLYKEDRERVFIAHGPVLIYGFYDMPKPAAYNMFGIDAPDELYVQINADTVSAKLGEMPLVGTLLSIEGLNWTVTNRAWIYNRFIGKYRLELQCQRYQESVTTAGKNGMQHVPAEDEV